MWSSCARNDLAIDDMHDVSVAIAYARNGRGKLTVVCRVSIRLYQVIDLRRTSASMCERLVETQGKGEESKGRERLTIRAPINAPRVEKTDIPS